MEGEQQPGIVLRGSRYLPTYPTMEPGLLHDITDSEDDWLPASLPLSLGLWVPGNFTPCMVFIAEA
jgi:hypothetical protein